MMIERNIGLCQKKIYKTKMNSEKIILSGHIIDSLTLPKVLDEIIELGGDCTIDEIEIGRTRRNPSRAVINVSAPDNETLRRIMTRIKRQGKLPGRRGCHGCRAFFEGTLPDPY